MFKTILLVSILVLLVALILFIIIARKAFVAMGKGIKDLFVNLKNIFVNFGKTIVESFKNIGRTFVNAFTAIKNAFKAVGDGFVNFFKSIGNFFKSIGTAFKNFFKAIGDFFINLPKNIAKCFIWVGKKILNFFKLIGLFFVNVFLFLWQFEQHLYAGFLFLINIGAVYSKRVNGVKVYFAKRFPKSTSISLGNFLIFAENTDPETHPEYFDVTTKTVIHEYGHSIQSKIFGPIYVLVIGVPSFITATIKRIFKKDSVWYHKRYPEHWADVLGEKYVRKYAK
jgi:hypothetical protein